MKPIHSEQNAWHFWQFFYRYSNRLFLIKLNASIPPPGGHDNDSFVYGNILAFSESLGEWKQVFTKKMPITGPNNAQQMESCHAVMENILFRLFPASSKGLESHADL